MKKLKTFDYYAELNYREIAFFKGCSTLTAKTIVADYLKIKTVTPTGIPKVSLKDKIPVGKVPFVTFSHSAKYEGKNLMEVVIKSYNEGITLTDLREFSQNEAYIKAMRFTGAREPLNDILNREQLLKLQKTWLEYNLYRYKRLSKTAKQFIEKNEWARELAKKQIVAE